MKKFTLTLLALLSLALPATAQIRDTARVYDTVTEADTFYLFPAYRPCINPMIYLPIPGGIMMQEYVATDTVTVYGVAITMENHYEGLLDIDTNNGYSKLYQALMMNRMGVSPINPRAFSFSIVDTVSLYRAHPRFCWFHYEGDCDSAKSLVTPCYEFYFDTPTRINNVTDTFYVGRNYQNTVISPDVRFFPNEYGGEFDASLPGTIYQGGLGYDGIGLDLFFHLVSPHDKKWGVAFPIIGFRCGPVKQYWLEEYGGNYAIVRWRSTEEGTLYNVRLVGDDGSDTTVVTPDTVYVFNNLSDSVRYNVMLRRQCHYATSNYDTTVHSDWASSIYFGTSLLSTVWRTVTVGVNNPHWGAVNGGGVYADSSTVTLIAGAYEGYAFDAWNDGVTDNPRQVLVTSDTAFTAIFRDVEDTVGIMRPGAEGFTLRPNPAHGTVQIQLPTSAKGGLLTLCDLTGRELEVRTVTATTMEWDVSALPAGAYLIKLTTPQGSATKKLTVSR